MKGELRILCGEGDHKILWDTKKSDSIAEAEGTFDRLKKKKWKAYSVKRTGSKNKAILDFDPALGSIIMVPPIAGG
jgi:hypothetical protein